MARTVTAETTVSLVESVGRTADLTRLVDPAYWGRPIDDDRYIVTSRAPTST